MCEKWSDSSSHKKCTLTNAIKLEDKFESYDATAIVCSVYLKVENWSEL